MRWRNTRSALMLFDMTDSTPPSDRTSATPPELKDARKELFEALDHFKTAATIMFDRAAKDPSLQKATSEAERVVLKIGAGAEPLAKHLAGELSKLSKSIAEAIDGRRKSETPPPPDNNI